MVKVLDCAVQSHERTTSSNCSFYRGVKDQAEGCLSEVTQDDLGQDTGPRVLTSPTQVAAVKSTGSGVR